MAPNVFHLWRHLSFENIYVKAFIKAYKNKDILKERQSLKTFLRSWVTTQTHPTKNIFKMVNMHENQNLKLFQYIFGLFWEIWFIKYLLIFTNQLICLSIFQLEERDQQVPGDFSKNNL